MSSSNASVSLIESLNNASNLINQYLPILIYIFGVIGNVLNVLVLSQQTLRTTPSAVFFLVSSIAGLIVILSGLTSRIMSGYGLDLTLTIDWICKLRNVILYGARTILLWMIVLATIDRYISSSIHVHYRQMSNMKNVQRSIYVALIGTSLVNAPIIFCYQANVAGALRSCYGSTYMCRISTDLIYAFGTTLLPLLLMIIFGLMTIRNVHAVRRRIQAVTGSVLSHENRNTVATENRRRQTRKRDRSLLRMLFVQVTLFTLLTCPHASQKLYSTFVSTSPPQSLQNAIQTLVFNCFTLFAFVASGIPFYIYTLVGGSVFRNALFELVKTLTRKFFCH